MRYGLFLAAAFSLALVTSADGRPGKSPLNRAPTLINHPLKMPPSGKSGGAVHAAQQDTIYFGGTFWNADSARWEALRDSVWTFDSGVGSHFDLNDPYVDPYKTPGLHACMEGWRGIDFTRSEVTYFRRITDDDPRWETNVCVGGQGGLGGSASYWCGIFRGEADDLCYYAGQGYGNQWNVCIGRTFPYPGSGSVNLDFDYANDTEEGYDFTYVIVDTSGFGDDVIVDAYTGPGSDHAALALAQGESLPGSPGDIVIKFCVSSDELWSDEDGLNPTTCGAFAVDNIVLSGAISDGPADFETGDDGWLLLPGEAGDGGDWSDIVSLADLPAPLTPCPCTMADSVLVFQNLLGGHDRFQDNVAVSPWIDLKAAGLVGVPEEFVEFGGYFQLPVLNYVFISLMWQFYPMQCPATGKLITSPMLSYAVFGGWAALCTQPGQPVRLAIGGGECVHAERLRIALGVVNYCRFYGNCTGSSNSSPWFDNVRVGVSGNPNAPSLWWSWESIPQDAFPSNGTLRMDAPGRIDGGFVAEDGWMDDALGVLASTGGAEVRVQFSVRPGPGIDSNRLASWLASHQPEGTWQGLPWYSARMDSAEFGDVASAEEFTACYHEEDPNFSGTDLDPDPLDLHPGALANDIFPDDLFTPGTRVNLFYKARFEGGNEWYTAPDTTGGNYFEMEVLPSSMEVDSTFNCVLYVNFFPGPRALYEEALSNVLPGPSSNFEETGWDRYNSGSAGLGRPLYAAHGASVTQLLGYKVILWDSPLRKTDSDVLIPWLTLRDVGFNSLYLSRDDVITYVVDRSAAAPSARVLLEDIAGVRLGCSSFRESGCPAASPFDDTYCVGIDPVAGAVVSTRPQGGTPVAGGNGCPEQYSFDVLVPNQSASFGTAIPEERYVTGIKSGEYASISLDADGSQGSIYRTVVDGLYLSRRSPASECPDGDESISAMEERLEEVLGWFGYLGASSCSDPTVGLGLPGDDQAREAARTALLPFSPNPLSGGATGRVHFTMARPGKAVVEVFDVNGRLVRKIFDGPAPQGSNEASWDGSDFRGHPLAGGVYYLRLRAGGKDFSRTLVVLPRGF